MVLYNKNYSNAIRNDNQMEIIVSGAMYDDLVFEESQLVNQARKYQMDLERLAGKKTVQNLNLYQYAFKNELFSQKLMNANSVSQKATGQKNTQNGGQNANKK